jgi:membrane protease YdiL (CAAX protease family)
MPDPTELAITFTFIAALGVFLVAMILRAAFSNPRAGGDHPEASMGETPAPPTLPPPIPVGRVSTWVYQPVDLLGVGLIYLIFSFLVVGSLRASEASELEIDPSALVASIIMHFTLAGIALAFMIRRISPVEWLGLRWREWPWVGVIAPVSVFSMWSFFIALEATGFMDWIESLGVETVQDSVKLLQSSLDPATLGLMTFAAVIVAPLCEEIVFRGYFYPVAKRFAGPWAAGICSALVFAAAHGNLAALLPLFVFGGLLVFLYEKTGSLWAPVAVHFCFNGATVLFQFAARHYNLPLDGP